MSNTVASTFARNLFAFSRREIPEQAYDRARTAIVDTLGVTLAGAVHDGSKILREVIVPTAANGPSRVFGTDLKLNSLDAALLNGAAAHMLDFDDSNSHLHGHVSVAVLPALLAAADEKNINGRKVLHAYIAGFETAARMGNTVSRRQYTLGWHPTTTVGIFGAVGALAVLLTLSEEETATAFSLTTSLASGIKSNFGTMTKPLIVGHANRNALMAVKLAQSGFSAGARAFEHHQGFFAVFNGDPSTYDASFLTEPWEDEIRLLDRSKGNKQKRFPCCYAIQPPLDGILKLREQHNLTVEDIARVEIGVHPIRYPHINVPEPENPLAAKFATNYTVARALVAGEVVMEDYEEDARFNDPATRALMPLVSLYKYDSDNTGGAAIAIETKDGRRLETFVAAALGSTYDYPLPPQAVPEKFIACASRAIGKDSAQALLARLEADDFA
jgi:2-methylcitrate dehydratase PrpD